MARIAILGAGMSGMAAAKVLADQDVVVFESQPHAGGHASSFSSNGFTFDEGPHVSFTSNSRIREYLASSVRNRFLEHPSEASNYYQGISLKHPVQTNLRNLPPESISECIEGFVRAQYEDNREIRSYRDWCYKQLGAPISEKFTRLYTRKYWTRELEDLSTDWVAERIYAPKLAEVLDGALGARQSGKHYYMSTFRYPERGGFHSYSRSLESGSRICFGKRVTEIDLRYRKLTFADSGPEYFDYLISTIPIPELVDIIAECPSPVKDAAASLACTSHYLVSVGINRPHISEPYWTYYYDEDIPFSRLSFPSKFSPHTAPEGCSSVQAEVVHSRFRALNGPESITERCVEAMLKTGVIHSKQEIVSVDSRDIKYANVIFDFNRKSNLGLVQGYLAEKGIRSCGRFGEWAYLWTDQSILSGERAANEVRSLLGLEGMQFDGVAPATNEEY